MLTKFAIPCYDKKAFFCGDYVIFKEYSLPIVTGQRKSELCFKSFLDEFDRAPKRSDNLKRARDTVAALIYTNLTPNTKFLTLTTRDAVLEVRSFMRLLTTFLQQMKRYGFDLEYIYVLERQLNRGRREGNEGSLHAHFVIFNNEFIPLDVLQRAWHHGYIDIKILNGLRAGSSEAVLNPAAYICKYITKESVAEWNEKVFRCSKGLKRPLVVVGQGALTPSTFFRLESSEALAEHINEDYCPLYNTCQKARYSNEGRHKTNFIEITIAKRKDS